MASLSPAWHSVLPEQLLGSRLVVWGDGCIDPPGPWAAQPPSVFCTTTEGGLSPAPRGSHSLPPSHLYSSCLWIILPTVRKATCTLSCLCSVPQLPHLILPDLPAGQDQASFSCLMHRFLLTLLYTNAFPQSHKTHSFPQKTEFLRGFFALWDFRASQNWWHTLLERC